MKKMIFIQTIFSFFPFCSKNEKIEKWHTYCLIFHNSILTRKMKKMTSVANNFSIFSINRKQTNKQKRIIFHLLFLWKIAKKNDKSWTFTNREKKNLIHFRLTSFVRRFTQGRRRRGMGRVGGGALVVGMRK